MRLKFLIFKIKVGLFKYQVIFKIEVQFFKKIKNLDFYLLFLIDATFLFRFRQTPSPRSRKIKKINLTFTKKQPLLFNNSVAFLYIYFSFVKRGLKSLGVGWFFWKLEGECFYYILQVGVIWKKGVGSWASPFESTKKVRLTSRIAMISK